MSVFKSISLMITETANTVTAIASASNKAVGMATRTVDNMAIGHSMTSQINAQLNVALAEAEIQAQLDDDADLREKFAEVSKRPWCIAPAEKPARKVEAKAEA